VYLLTAPHVCRLRAGRAVTFLYQARATTSTSEDRQRLGYLPVALQSATGDESIWGAAVIGREVAQRPDQLITELRARYPKLRLFLSTTTLTGQQLAPAERLGMPTRSFYFPFDWAFTARRTLNVVKPRLFRDDGDGDSGRTCSASAAAGASGP